MENSTSVELERIKPTRLKFGSMGVINGRRYPMEQIRNSDMWRLFGTDGAEGFSGDEYGRFVRDVTPEDIENAYKVSYYAQYQEIKINVLSQDKNGTLTLAYPKMGEFAGLDFKETERGMITATYFPKVVNGLSIKPLYRRVSGKLKFTMPEDAEKEVDFYPNIIFSVLPITVGLSQENGTTITLPPINENALVELINTGNIIIGSKDDDLLKKLFKGYEDLVI